MRRCQHLAHRLRLLVRKAVRRIRSPLGFAYGRWIRHHDALDQADRRAIDERICRLREPPLIAVLLPVFDPPLAFLEACIESVKSQMYPHWQLCICDDASKDPAVVAFLQSSAAADPRIRLMRRDENGHISRATNDALALADAPWIALLDHDDLLRPHALALIAETIEHFPHAQLIYSDEDKVDASGTRRQPYFKPDWNPALLLGQNYLCHLSTYRRERVLALGGMRPGFEGAQDHDLALRFTEGLALEAVVHVPHVLYHWREHIASTASLAQAKPYSVDAARRAVTESLQRRDIRAKVETVAGMWQAVRPAPPASLPRVTVLIQTRNGIASLRRCIDALLSMTAYIAFEVLVVDNGSTDRRFVEELTRVATLPRCRVLRDTRHVNFAARANAAVASIESEYVLLLDDDTEVITADWMDVMLGWCNMQRVGAVCARLWHTDGSLQYAGTVLGMGDVAGFVFRQWLREELGEQGRGTLAQDFSACSSACLLVRRQAYLEVGGMDEVGLVIAFSDIDFSLRLRQAGWRMVWTPEAELVSHASPMLGSHHSANNRSSYSADVEVMRDRWRACLTRDPAYNPNLSLVSDDYRLAQMPRVSLQRAWFAD